VNVADYQELARAVLPAPTYDYIATGSTDEVTLRDNVAAFQRIRLRLSERLEYQPVAPGELSWFASAPGWESWRAC
jgi:isopentenyl diphosphate isomerase/L-lactate dehydrogenase-like FMN-dependent dehydrogenase